ncbi:MAG: glycoside hydrolase family 16 protein [Clostridia bacterium]|nr:glycoside hydrolase family 16 protein [Clostridia bacterium]
MNRVIALLIALLALLSPTLPQKLTLGKLPSETQVDMSRFEPVWNDEFDGDTLDLSKWGYTWWETMRKGGYWHEDMVKVENGNLVISTQYFDEPLEYRYPKYDWVDDYGPGYYTGVITTRDKYEQCYGYFEVRCKLPAARGMWSAFWMMNDKVVNVDGFGDDGTEVDVFESMYYKDHWWGDDCVIGGIHYDGYGPEEKGDSIGKIFVKGDPYKEFNTYGLEWSPDEYIFYINGYECGRISTGGVSDNPEYLLLSCEVAGHDGIADADRHGTGKIDLTPKANWPAEFVVDYVRCYQYKNIDR